MNQSHLQMVQMKMATGAMERQKQDNPRKGKVATGKCSLLFYYRFVLRFVLCQCSCHYLKQQAGPASQSSWTSFTATFKKANLCIHKKVCCVWQQSLKNMLSWTWSSLQPSTIAQMAITREHQNRQVCHWCFFLFTERDEFCSSRMTSMKWSQDATVNVMLPVTSGMTGLAVSQWWSGEACP